MGNVDYELTASGGKNKDGFGLTELRVSGIRSKISLTEFIRDLVAMGYTSIQFSITERKDENEL